MCRDIQSITLKLASLYDNLRFDTLAAAAFIELLYPVKYTIFSVNEDL